MEPSVFLFVSTASDPISGHHGEVPVYTPFLQVFVYTDEIPPEPSTGWTLSSSSPNLSSQQSCPSPLTILVIFHWAFQCVHISLVLRKTEYLVILKLYDDLFWEFGLLGKLLRLSDFDNKSWSVAL